jgi:hypothetical protein
VEEEEAPAQTLTLTLVPHRRIAASPHRHITTSPHHHITTTTHQHITTSPHQHITTSPHRISAPRSIAAMEAMWRQWRKYGDSLESVAMMNERACVCVHAAACVIVCV